MTGRFKEGFFALRVWGAYIWRGLYMEGLIFGILRYAFLKIFKRLPTTLTFILSTYVQKCMQWRKWRNWRKIASCCRVELDAKSGPFEAGDFGEIGDFRKKRHACNGETREKSPACGDLNWMPKVAPWRLAILAKMAILAKLAILAKIARGQAMCGKIFKLDAKSGPFKVDN